MPLLTHLATFALAGLLASCAARTTEKSDLDTIHSDSQSDQSQSRPRVTTLGAQKGHPIALSPDGRTIYSTLDCCIEQLDLITMERGIAVGRACDDPQCDANPTPGAPSSLRVKVAALAVRMNGDLVFATATAVYELAKQRVVQVAGTALSGHVDGPASEARFDRIQALAVQNSSVWVAEPGYLRELKDGIVTTKAGRGEIQSPAAYESSDALSVSFDRLVALAVWDSNLHLLTEGGALYKLAGTQLEWLGGLAWTQVGKKEPPPADGETGTSRIGRGIAMAASSSLLYFIDGRADDQVRSWNGREIGSMSMRRATDAIVDGHLTTATFGPIASIAAASSEVLYIVDLGAPQDEISLRQIELR